MIPLTTSQRALSPRRLLGAIFGNWGVRLVGVASGIVVAAALARNLSHADFGRFSLLLSLVVMAAAIGDLGLANTAIRQVSIDPDSGREVLGALIAARSITGLAGAICVATVALAVDGAPEMKMAAPLVAATLLVSPLLSWLALAQARLRLGRVNGLLLLQSLIWMIFVLLLAARGASIVGYAWGFLCAAFIQSVATWLSFRSQIRPTFAGMRTRLRQLFLVAWPIAIGGILVTTYYRVDGVILYNLKGASANADYSAAYRFLDVLQFIPGALLLVVLPLLSATWRPNAPQGHARRVRLFRLALTVTLATSLPVAVGGALLASKLVRLVYGDAFDQASPLLATLLLAFPAIAFGYITVGLALASARTRLYAVTAGFAAVINVIANILLIPHFGAMAAAWITVVTEFGMVGVLLAVLTRTERLPLPWAAWAGSGAATGFMAVAVVALKDGPLPVAILVPGSVYIIAALSLRAVSRSDIKAVLGRHEMEWS